LYAENEDKEERRKTLFLYRKWKGKVQETEPPPHFDQKVLQTEAESPPRRHFIQR
jgi:hypothetical protein